MERAEFISSVLGKPWRANARGPEAFDCWHLACWVEAGMFNRGLPLIDVPDAPSWSWMIRSIADHPERKNWKAIPFAPAGLVLAQDGAIVLMARSDRPAHVGVWLKPERRIIHADPNHGVVCDGLLDLRAKGWAKLRFYEHA